MRKYIIILLIITGVQSIIGAQTVMNLHLKNTSTINFKISMIDSVIKSTIPQENIKIYTSDKQTKSFNIVDIDSITFTSPQLPILSTILPSSITKSSAVSGGNIINNGGASIISNGVCWSTSQNPTIELISKTNDLVNSSSFSSTITGLLTNTKYYIRSYATNIVGTTYGNEYTITTLSGIDIPQLTTNYVSNITDSSAYSGGIITSDGGGIITAQGIVWSTNPFPTISLSSKTNENVNATSFSSQLLKLTSNTKYYVRAYATNSIGTAYGNEINFTTSLKNTDLPGTVKDNEGNSYKTVVIGTQEWMAENLRSTKFSNGDLLYKITDTISWRAIKQGGYTYYDFDTKNQAIYGNLYNSSAVVDDRNVCPAGWRVPIYNDFKILNDYLSIFQFNKLAEVGTTHWTNSTTTQTNSSGFTALPGGIINLNLKKIAFASINHLAVFHTSTMNYNSYDSFDIDSVFWSPIVFQITDDNSSPGEVSGPLMGGSVRCIKQTKGKTLTNLSTSSATNISATKATVSTIILNDGGSTISAAGVILSKSKNPLVDNRGKVIATSSYNTSKSFTVDFTNLRANTTYFIRAFSVNENGPSYGNEITFKTGQVELTTFNTSSLTASYTFVEVYSEILSDGGDVVTKSGVCWDIVPSPTINSSKTTDGKLVGKFTSKIYGLIPGTKYYFRTYAINAAGISYGKEVSITTLSYINPKDAVYNPNLTYDSIKDIDGNYYKTVKIANQIWMADNLRVSRFNNGDSIMYYDNFTDVSKTKLPAYCYFKFDTSVNKVYGKLYNEMVITDKRKVCPVGWHVPQISEFKELSKFLGGDSISGAKMKEVGNTHWPNKSVKNTGTNTAGFTALPVNYTINVNSVSNSTMFWSYTKNEYSWCTGNSTLMLYDTDKQVILNCGGNSTMTSTIRCMKDSLAILETSDVYSITSTTALIGTGEIIFKGYQDELISGFCWSTSNTTPTIQDNLKYYSANNVQFSGLIPNTKYYYRNFAKNSAGINYGTVKSFTTKPK